MKKISVTVMLPHEIVLQLNDLCERCGVPRSFIICEMVTSSLTSLHEVENVTRIVDVLKMFNK